MSTSESEKSKPSESSDEKRKKIDSSLMNGKSRISSGNKSPIKQAQSPQQCTWCLESKTPLKYVLPTQNGKKEFCSETCIAEFRKAYSKGSCIECDNAIRANAPNREFCSTFCLNKHNKKKNTNSTSAVQASPSTSQQNNNSKTSSQLNNNNNNLSNNNNKKSETNNNNTNIKDQIHYPQSKISPMFQYEAFQVFDWKEYLKVSIFSTLHYTIVDLY
jgi:polycomb protein SCMH1